MAGALVVVLVRYAARTAVPLRAHPGRVLAAARGGVPLLVRTLALRAVLLVTTWVAAGLGDVPLAAYQVTATIWTFLAFALDALAIAAQAITGKALGAGEVDRTRDATSLMVRWGVVVGIVLGVLLLLVRPVPRPALHARRAGAGRHRRRPARRGARPAAVGLRLRRRRRAHRRGRRRVAGPRHARDPRRLPAPRRWRCTPPATGCSRAARRAGEVNAVMWLWIAFTAFMSVRGGAHVAAGAHRPLDGRRRHPLTAGGPGGGAAAACTHRTPRPGWPRGPVVGRCRLRRDGADHDRPGAEHARPRSRRPSSHRTAGDRPPGRPSP